MQEGPHSTPPLDPPPQNAGSSNNRNSSTGLSSNVGAGLACLIPLITGIVFLLIEKKDQFVRFWAMQSVLLGVMWLVIYIILAIASFLLIHIPVIGLIFGLIIFLLDFAVSVVWLCIYVYCLIQAFSGKEWDIPYIGRIAREQLEKISP